LQGNPKVIIMDPRELLSRNSAVKFVAVGGVLFCAISAISYVALGYQALPWINNRKDRIKRKKSGTVNIGGNHLLSISHVD
jgi:hypothetical protein